MTVFAPWADQPPLRCLFLNNMVVDAHIGVFPHEQGVTQRVRISVTFGVQDDDTLNVGVDDLSRTVSYRACGAIGAPDCARRPCQAC